MTAQNEDLEAKLDEMEFQEDGRDYTGPENLPNPDTYLEKVDASVGATERIARLFKLMQPQKRLLNAIMVACSEPRNIDELTEVVDSTKGKSFSLFGADSLCRQLVKAGALEESSVEPEPTVVVVDGVEYLEPAPEGEAVLLYKTTPAGVEYMQQVNSLGAFSAILEEDDIYKDIYRILLDLCANEGGATAKQMDEAVNGEPVLQQPRMYASYFFDRMSSSGLIEWTSAWTITDLGRKAVAFLDQNA